MAFNLVSEIMRFITPSIVEKIASALGVNGDLAKKGITIAIPALLAVLGSKASTPVGAKALSGVVAQADEDIFGKLSGALTGATTEKFVESGNDLLSSLLGNDALSGVTGAIAKQIGLGSAAASSLTAIASQLALGGLAKTAKSSDLDASGLANLLGSQQDNIKAALPSGLGSLLSSTGVVSSGFAEQAGRTANEARRATNVAASQAKAATKGDINWLMWIIPLAIIAAALWYFLGQGPKVPTSADTGSTPALTDLMVDGVDLTKQVTSALDGLKATLGGVTDAATAQTALPKLQEAATAIDGISGMLDKLSSGQKTALAAFIAAELPTIREMAANVLQIEGVGEVAKPVIDSLITKLETFSKTG